MPEGALVSVDLRPGAGVGHLRQVAVGVVGVVELLLLVVRLPGVVPHQLHRVGDHHVPRGEVVGQGDAPGAVGAEGVGAEAHPLAAVLGLVHPLGGGAVRVLDGVGGVGHPVSVNLNLVTLESQMLNKKIKPLRRVVIHNVLFFHNGFLILSISSFTLTSKYCYRSTKKVSDFRPFREVSKGFLFHFQVRF